MISPQRYWTVIESITIVVALTIIAGQALGQPILLGFVETGSMQPVLQPGDGFVAIPPALAGPVEGGDVVVYEAEEIQGGGLTTHRVVRETEEGYITKGDANPFTDQDSGEPVVKRSQIVAVVPRIGGQVVVVPRLGRAATGVLTALTTIRRTLAGVFGVNALLGPRGVGYVIFLLSLVWYGVGELTAERERSRSRSRQPALDDRIVVMSLTLLLLTSATAAMVVPAGSQQFPIVSSEAEDERSVAIDPGAEREYTFGVGNAGVVPVIVFLQTPDSGTTVSPEQVVIDGRAATNATVTVQAPTEPGRYRRVVVQHRYLAVLPTPIVHGLYRLHPWAPIVVIDAAIGIPFYLLASRLIGAGRIRSRPSRSSIGTRLRRLFP